ncbi:MAG: hypothetical protein NC203_04020 [Firmicutes bacterium]|nr:hypothetical protein [[Eubacterium] siraeum]MCM1487515.1 hypothetical protein [Bacillota bacterium]
MKLFKRFKLLAVFCLAAAICVSPSIYAEENNPLQPDDGLALDMALKEYFGKREDDFSHNYQASSQAIDNFFLNGEITAEEMRPLLIAELGVRWDVLILSASTSYAIKDTQFHGDTVYLDIYEWTNVNYGYSGKSGLTSTMGYGTDHEMILEKVKGEYSIVSDTYDEGPLTGMYSALTQEEFFQLVGENFSKLTDTENNHTPWAYGYLNIKRSLYSFADIDIPYAPSGAAELKYKTKYYARLDNSSDMDCFVFTAPGTGKYKMQTTGNTDTYGKLCSSDGTVIAIDDNSGDYSNFLIECRLENKQTYYLYVSSLRPVQGIYGVLIAS